MTRSIVMEGKKVASAGPDAAAGAAAAGLNGATAKEKPDRRSAHGGENGSGAMDLSEENVDAFYKKMLVRAPNKRQIKPVNRKELLNRLDLKKFEKNTEQSESESDEDFKLNEKDKDHSSGSEENSDSDKDDETDKNTDDDAETDGRSEGELEGGGGSVSDNENVGKFDTGSRISNDDTEVQLSTDNSTIGFSTGESTPQAVADEPFQLAKAASALSSVASGSRFPVSTSTGVLICTVCLKQTSEVNDEIVECDACGVCVHEGCYGVSDTQSIASTDSSASTEPWFCDSCKAGVSDPICQVCPNRGGIFKETDMGDWIHMICALYVPGIAFSNVDTLSNVTLFEISSSRFGAKECLLCEDESLNRAGITVGCDAGLCRAHFHATCAQRFGLLSETRPQEGAAPGEPDPYWASCKQHVDKDIARVNKRNWTAARAHTRCFKSRPIDDAAAHERIKRKLAKRQTKFAVSRCNRLPTWIPAQKMARALESSPSAVEMLHRKAEQMGIGVANSQAHRKHVLELQMDEGKKKGFVAPAFSVEFMTYFTERNRRVEEAKQAQHRLEEANEKLKREEFALRHKYEQEIQKAEERKKETKVTQDAFINLWRLVECLSGKTFELPKSLRRQRRRISGKGPQQHPFGPNLQPQTSPNLASTLIVKSGLTEENREKCHVALLKLPAKPSPLREEVTSGVNETAVTTSATKTTTTAATTTTKGMTAAIVASSSAVTCLTSSQESSPDKGGVESLLRQCKNCRGKQEQFNMIDCDDCKEWYHLGCLEPPLTRMPKKTKKFGWACSECTADSDDQEDEQEKLRLKAKEPRQLRNNRKKPKKFSDGESPVSTPSKENCDVSDGGGTGGEVVAAAAAGAGAGAGAGVGGAKAADVKKAASSRELSRLSDDVVVAPGPRTTRGRKQSTPNAAPAPPASSSASTSTPSSTSSSFSTLMPSPSSSSTPFTSSSSLPSTSTTPSFSSSSSISSAAVSLPAQSEGDVSSAAPSGRSRRRSSRGLKGAAAAGVKASSTDASTVQSAAVTTTEAPATGVDRKLLSSMTELIESLVESSKKRHQQQQHPQKQRQLPIAVVALTPTSIAGKNHSVSAASAASNATKRSTRSLGKKDSSASKPTTATAAPAAPAAPAVVLRVVEGGREEEEEEEEPPMKKSRGWDEEEVQEPASPLTDAPMTLPTTSASSSTSSCGVGGPSVTIDPSSLTPIPSPTETNSVGGGETSSASNDDADAIGGDSSSTAEVPRKSPSPSAEGDESRKLGDCLADTSASAAAGVDLFKADYAKALAFSPPRLNSSPSSSLVSCFSSPFHQRHHHHHHHHHHRHGLNNSSLFTSPPHSHLLFPAPPKLKVTSSRSSLNAVSSSSSSSFSSSSSSSFAKAAGFNVPPNFPFAATPTPTFTTLTEPGCATIDSTTKGKFSNPLEVRVQDDRGAVAVGVGGSGVGEGAGARVDVVENDLVEIIGPPSTFAASSPRRTGGGSVSPKMPWKGSKKSGKMKNKLSRRSGEADTSIEILTSFDQLTLAPPVVGESPLKVRHKELEEEDEEEEEEEEQAKRQTVSSLPQTRSPPQPQAAVTAPAIKTATTTTTTTTKMASVPSPPSQTLTTKPQSKEELTIVKLFSSSSSSSSCALPPTLTKSEVGASSSTPSSPSPSSSSSALKKREKKESFFCDFKSIPKFPKISSAKSDFHLPPSIFAAAAAVVDAKASEAAAVASSDNETFVDGFPKAMTSTAASETPSANATMTQRRLLNGDKKSGVKYFNHSFSIGADAKSSDEYDFISSPERTPSPIKAFASPRRERKSSADERRALDFDPEKADDDDLVDDNDVGDDESNDADGGDVATTKTSLSGSQGLNVEHSADGLSSSSTSSSVGDAAAATAPASSPSKDGDAAAVFLNGNRPPLSASTSSPPQKSASHPPASISNPSRKQVDLQMAKMQQRAPSKRQIKMKRRFSLDEEERRIEAEKLQLLQQQQLRKGIGGGKETEIATLGGGVDVGDEVEEEDSSPTKKQTQQLQPKQKRAKGSKKTAARTSEELIQDGPLSPEKYPTRGAPPLPSPLPPSKTHSSASSPPPSSPKKRTASTASLACPKCDKKTGSKASFVRCTECGVSFHVDCVDDVEGKEEEEEATKREARWTTTTTTTTTTTSTMANKKTPPKRGRPGKSFRRWKCDSCRSRGRETTAIGAVAVMTVAASPIVCVTDVGDADKIRQISPRSPVRRLVSDDGEKTNPFAAESLDADKTEAENPDVAGVPKGNIATLSGLCNGVAGKNSGIEDIGMGTGINEADSGCQDPTSVLATEEGDVPPPKPPPCGGGGGGGVGGGGGGGGVLSASTAPSSTSSSASPGSPSTPLTQPRFDCDRCSKSFTNKAHVNRHVQSVHLKIQHRCEQCDKKFTRKDRLTEHLKQAHSPAATTTTTTTMQDGDAPKGSSAPGDASATRTSSLIMDKSSTLPTSSSLPLMRRSADSLPTGPQLVD